VPGPAKPGAPKPWLRFREICGTRQRRVGYSDSFTRRGDTSSPNGESNGEEPKQLDELFHDTLKDIYFAEKKILATCPKWQKRRTAKN
jgi:hypothetical protein